MESAAIQQPPEFPEVVPPGPPNERRPGQPASPSDPALRGIQGVTGPVEVRYACYVGTGFKQQECTMHKGSTHWKFKGFLWAHRNQGREGAIAFAGEAGTYEVIRAHPDEGDWTRYIIDAVTGDTVSKAPVVQFVSQPNY